MFEFEFRRTTRKCHISGRTLAPGEEYYSVLLEEGDQLVRQDISCEQWQGPLQNCIGWWKSRLPDLEQGRVYWAPRDVLLSFFHHLRQQPQNPDLVYVTALLLLQKKILRLVDTIHVDGKQMMQLLSPTDNERFEVPMVEVPPDRIQAIQQKLAEKLFTDVAAVEENI